MKRSDSGPPKCPQLRHDAILTTFPHTPVRDTTLIFHASDLALNFNQNLIFWFHFPFCVQIRFRILVVRTHYTRRHRPALRIPFRFVVSGNPPVRSLVAEIFKAYSLCPSHLLQLNTKCISRSLRVRVSTSGNRRANTRLQRDFPNTGEMA